MNMFCPIKPTEPTITHWQYLQKYPDRHYLAFRNGVYYNELRVILTKQDYDDFIFYKTHYNTLYQNVLESEDIITNVFGNPPTVYHWYFSLSWERKSEMTQVFIANYELN